MRTFQTRPGSALGDSLFNLVRPEAPGSQSGLTRAPVVATPSELQDDDFVGQLLRVLESSDAETLDGLKRRLQLYREHFNGEKLTITIDPSTSTVQVTY